MQIDYILTRHAKLNTYNIKVMCDEECAPNVDSQLEILNYAPSQSLPKATLQRGKYGT